MSDYDDGDCYDANYGGSNYNDFDNNYSDYDW